MDRVTDQSVKPPESVQTVVQVVASVARDLHPQEEVSPRLGLESCLERDAGLDSLSRMELLTRLERTFGREFPEEGVLTAESVEDLVRLVGPVPVEAPGLAREFDTASPSAVPVGVPETVEAPSTVVEMLQQLVAEDRHRVVIRLLVDGEHCEDLTVGELYRSALALVPALRGAVRPGDPVAIMLPTGRDFLDSFFAALLAGGVPVPLAPPARLSQVEDHVRRQVGILESCRAPLMVVAPEVASVARLAALQVDSLTEISSVEALRSDRVEVEVRPASPQGDDLALLQYTSGSTGDPKGVMLTHANLLANIDAIARRLETGPADVYVSWLPLYHDMGLIGGVLHALYCRIPLVLLSPLAFLARPARWLRAIDRFGGTMTVAPNFAYEICRRRLRDEDLEGLDLSSLRLTLNGAEPVSVATIQGFTERFRPYGYRAEAMAPCYGLAENTLAVSCARMSRVPTVDWVDRESLQRDERALPVEESGQALSFIGCGPLMRGVEVRLVGAGGLEVGEREIGRLQFRGTSATAGYYRNLQATENLIEGDWRESGDLAYQVGDQLFVTGRAKDIIIRAGLNIVPSAVEEAVGDIEGVRRGCVVAFGAMDRALGSERLVVAAESRITAGEEREHLIGSIKEAAIAAVGVAPDEVCLLPPRSILKTSSGKLRRTACRELYRRGHLQSRSQSAVWRQFLRIGLRGAGALAGRAIRALGVGLYSLYCWMLAGVLLATLWFGVLLLPRRGWRHVWARTLCRIFFKAVGPFSVEGVDNLPAGSCVLASNHASYLDSMLIFAAIPADLTFAAKREFEDHFVTRVLMKRLGTVFLDKSVTERAARSLATLRDLPSGGPLTVFVEGTFVREEGLRSFRLGAFQVAADAGIPVIPVVLQGTRRLLRDEQWWFRRSPVAVKILPPSEISMAGFAGAVALRDATRDSMAAVCGEPDLLRTATARPITESNQERAQDRMAEGL
jgi:1-acyl-sn-glycerol-3-phosphate acyltransferase